MKGEELHALWVDMEKAREVLSSDNDRRVAEKVVETLKGNILG
jgi:hypothetical protein